MDLYGDLETLSFVRRSRLHWIGEVNRIDSLKKKVGQVCISNPQRTTKYRWRNFVQTDINRCKIKHWKVR